MNEALRGRRVTLRTVAEAAGVHISTVSRTLKRHQQGASLTPEQEALVRLADDLGYTPNPNAASLKTGRSSAFGVLVPHLTDIVLSAAYDAIEATANTAGYETFVANTRDDPTAQRARLELLAGRQVDGLIIGDARLDDPDLADHLARRGLNAVLVNRRHPGLLSVTCDDYGGGALAARHLLSLGHRQIGVISGPPWSSTGFDRLSGFRDELREAGVDLPDRRTFLPGFDAAHGRDGMERLLRSDPEVTAVFVANDMAAIAALGVLARHGIRAGHDIAVVGYNDIDIAAALTVPLTTISSPFTDMGKRACETLLAQSNGLPVSSTVLPTRLVVRESSDPRSPSAQNL